MRARRKARWREEDPRARRTPGQRMADALAGLVTREDTDEKSSTPRGPRLLLIADYDVVSRELRNGSLGDGPIPVTEIRDLACRPEILPPYSGVYHSPLTWEGDGGPPAPPNVWRW